MEARVVTSVVFLLVMVVLSPSSADPVEDTQALYDFILSMPHTRLLNWNPFTSVCDTWVGVTCSGDRNRVIALSLPGFGFTGQIPPNTLGRLSALQTLSLRSNNLSGPFPPDFTSLFSLTDLHLQFNNFSGPLPENYFSGWRNLTELDLSFNSFTGRIPSSISNLTYLAALNLSNNSLSGKIPDLELPNLKLLNLSNNHLEGTIPRSLLKFPSSSFAGNALSTFGPSPGPSPMSPNHVPKSRSIGKKLSHPLILGIIVGGCALVFAVLVVCLILCCSRRKNKNVVSGKVVKGDRSPETVVAATREQNNRLVFFEGCTFVFDLEDLLRASAEVLGKGMFGTAYKAQLEDSAMVVVKRLKDVGVGKREFEQQMEVVGRIRHENVVELRAYYYSKDEKLMVYDYYSLGSVSSLLHGKRGEDRIPLDWDTRVKIALGAARGIEHIHMENSGKLVHGNIKSSNIFLNHQLYGCVSDLGITNLVNPMTHHVSRTAGYRAPEVFDNRKATQMSDVYSFGVVLLELLTGKSPIQVTEATNEVVHLVRWVQSVVREEWTAEVFDVELMRYPNIEEEMVEMLQIAMNCVVRMPEQRPKISEVVKMIAGVRRPDSRNQPSSEARSEESNGLPPTIPEKGSSSHQN